MAGTKSVRLMILGDNRDAEAKIKEIDAEADELKEKHPQLSIGIDTAAAAEKLRVLRAEIRETTVDADNLKRKLDEIKWEKLGAGARNFALIAAAAGPLPAILGAVGAGVVGVGANLVGAGIGLGIFGAVAKAEFTGVSTNIQAATKALDENQTTAAGAAKSNKDFTAALKGLDTQQRSLVTAAANADSGWHYFVKDAAGGINTVLVPALNLVPNLLGKMQLFLPGIERSLSGIVGKVGKSLTGGELGKFLTTMSKTAGPTLTRVGDIIGHIGDMAMKAMTALSPLGTKVLADIDNFLGKADSGSGGAIQKFLNWVSANGPAAMGILKNLGETLGNVGKSFISIGGHDLSSFSAIASLLATISKNPIGAGALAGLLVLVKVAQVVGPMVKLAEAFKLVAQSEKLAALGAMAFDAVPIVLAIAAIIAIVYLLITHWKQVKTVALDVFHGVLDIISDVWNWIKGHWPLLLGILLGPIALAAVEIVQHWDQIENGAKRAFDAVVNFARSLGGRILGAVGDLGGILVGAGEAIMHGLLSGIESGFDAVKNFVGGIASWISSHKGPIEYDATLLMPHGSAIMGGLVRGLQSGMPGLTQQLSRTTNVIASTRVPGLSGGASSAPLQVEWIGGSGADQEFITWLKKNIRIRGGNPAVLGR